MTSKARVQLNYAQEMVKVTYYPDGDQPAARCWEGCDQPAKWRVTCDNSSSARKMYVGMAVACDEHLYRSVREIIARMQDYRREKAKQR